MKRVVFLTLLLILFMVEPVFSQDGDKQPEPANPNIIQRLQLLDLESILDRLDFGIIKSVDLKEKTVYVRDNFHVKWGIPPGLIDQDQPFPNYNPYVRISLAGRSGSDSGVRRSSFIRPMGNIKIGRQFSLFSVEGGFRLDYVRVRQFNAHGKDIDEKEQKKVIIPAFFINAGVRF